ncbi:Dihydropteroate synthase [Trichlorobacter thiogenes]|uniref:Dihydropteroate synthase n=2 Tax=Trichlorobacter thiogenes TaxID=115783 RepID=A0A1T4NC70_9BACT|nr:Dihydropteroate synthase [Trichlorobacter thiogenes]
MIPGREYQIRALCLISPAAAQKELERIGVDPAGINHMLPKLEQHALLVPQVRAAAANILKQEMLSLGGDAAVARGTVACSVSSTDVLLIGTRKQLLTLCNKLTGQPFGLKTLASQLALFLKTVQQPPTIWQTSRRQLSLERPLIMGILNVTPDSFSDGGCYSTVEQAVERALQLEAEGADLLDIGGESTRPGAPLISAEEEQERVLPVIEALANRLSIPISIDTWKSSVADACLTAGAEIINDISGLNFDPALAEVIARHQAGLVVMHTRGTPQQMQQDTAYTDLMGEVTASLLQSAASARSAGIAHEQIALDPGIGFAKDLHGNLELLRRLSELCSLGYPLLVGTSRKSFIGKTLQREAAADRLFGTAATVAHAVTSGARIVRVHDVQAMKDVALMAHAINSQ